jgi:hypothetical protein
MKKAGTLFFFFLSIIMLDNYSLVEGAHWIHFHTFKTKYGTTFYYYDSVTLKSDVYRNKVRVWVQKDSDFELDNQLFYEIDCKERKFRIIQDRFSKKAKPWRNIASDSIDEALYKIVCP